jgi:hypothetical protein
MSILGVRRASRGAERTLFANQAVVAIIRVVCIAQPPIVILEFEELVPMSPGVARTDQCDSTDIVGIYVPALYDKYAQR